MEALVIRSINPVLGVALLALAWNMHTQAVYLSVDAIGEPILRDLKPLPKGKADTYFPKKSAIEALDDPRTTTLFNYAVFFDQSAVGVAVAGAVALLTGLAALRRPQTAQPSPHTQQEPPCVTSVS